MADVYGFSEEDAARIRNVIKRSEVEPKNRVQKRRLYPMFGSPGLLPVVIKENDDDDPVAIYRCPQDELFNPILPHIEYNAELIDELDENVCGPTSDPDKPRKVWGQMHHGVHCTGDIAWCRNFKGKLQIASTGSFFWSQAIIDNDAYLFLWDGGPRVAYESLDWDFDEGHKVEVTFDDQRQVFVVTGASCEETSDTE